jgi:DNA-binding beta-propeller fold protein YncE
LSIDNTTHHKRGTKVKPTQTIAKFAPKLNMGLIATLCAFLHVNGSGAPEIDRGTGTPKVSRRLILSVLATTLGALAFTVAPALAAAGHVFSTSFGETCVVAPGEPCEGKFNDPTGIAVNNATGDVYVVDKANSRIEEFNATGTKVIAEFSGPKGEAGELSEPEAIAIDNSGETTSEDPSLGDVYVTDHNVVDKFTATGEYKGQITEAEGTAFATLDGVAVDPKGQLWVYQANKQIDAFSDAQLNAFLSSRGSQARGSTEPAFAVNSEDNLYVGHGGEEEEAIAQLNSKGEVHKAALGGGERKTGVAVDPASNDVYIDSTEGTPGVQEFNPEDKEIESFGQAQLTDDGGRALTVSYASVSSGDVYVLDSSAGKVDIFAPSTPKVTSHVFSSHFSGSGASPLSEPTGVAVNNTTEDVYVVDKGNDRVVELNSTGTTVLAEFNGAAAPTGAFSEPEAIAVDNSGDSSAGDVYVTDSGHGVVDKFSASGTYLGQIVGTCENAGEIPPLCGSFAGFSRLLGLAVDAGGVVWISQESQAATSSEIDAFSDEETNGFLSRREPQTGVFAHFPLPGLAVDSEDNLYVTITRGTNSGRVAKLNSNGEALEKIGEEDFGGQPLGQSTGIAVDLSTDDVFLDYGSSVGEYTAAGSPIETFGSRHLTKGSGLAVNFSSGNAASGAVYVADTAANDVDIFNAEPLPQVAVGAASNLTPTSVTLEGSVTPEGKEVSSCEFEYGTTTAYGQTAECEPAAGSLGEGTKAVPVSAKLSGLPSGTTYHYRLVASNTIGTNQGSDNEVKTVGPEIGEEQVSSVEAKHATLEAQIDPNGDETTYHFEYDTRPYGEGEGPHGTSLPVPSVSIGSGTSAVPVSVRVGLEPGKTYYYRAVAQGEPLGAPESFYGTDKTFTTNPEPGSAPPQSCANEQRRAEQPFGLTLPDCRAYEIVSPVKTEGQNATEEKWDTSSRAAEEGAPAQPTSTPQSEDEEKGAVTYAASGSFSGTSAEPTGAAVENQYVSRRDPAKGRWETRAITPLHEPDETETGGSYTQDAFNPQLTEGIAQTNAPLTPEAHKTVTSGAGREFGLYVASFADGSYRYVTEENAALPLGVSGDLSHVVFGQFGEVLEWVAGTPFPVGVDNQDEVVPASVAGWRAVSATGSNVAFMRDGQLYVRVNTDQEQSKLAEREAAGSGTLTKGSKSVTELVVASGSTQESYGPGTTEILVNPVDGKFFVGQPVSGSGIEVGTTITAIAAGPVPPQEILTLSKPTEGHVGSVVSSGGPSPFAVGQRITGVGVPAGTTVTAVTEGSLTLSTEANLSETGEQLVGGGGCLVSTDACTVEASASERQAESPASQQPAQYQGASVDGSKVFFTSTAELTEDAYTGPAGEGANLYQYEPATNTLTDLTAADRTGPGADVQGVVQISEDGSYLYFVAKGVPTGTEENQQHERAKSEADNLYLSHDGVTTFITTLSSEDSADWGGTPETNTAVVSPNGSYLALLSKESLTGYDNEQAKPGDCEGTTRRFDEGENGKCREAYLYDAETGKLVCASCDPTGARPVGPANLGEPRNGGLYRPRVLTADGTLFFDSYDALVPHASDGLQNVYEFQDAQINPISNVAGGFPSFLLDASASGGDVYFATSDQLLPEDTSNNVVVYDARIDGGFPVAVGAPPCTTAEACRVASPPTPAVFGAPPSATFSGPGNVTPPPPAVVKPKILTRAQKLAAALKSCRKDKKKSKRQKCEKQARSKYGPVKQKTAKKTSHNGRAK